jgi:hypothetical protein
MKNILMILFAIALSIGANALWATPATEDLIKMARSGVDEEVLSAYIDASPDTYDLSADEIITLKDLGVPSKVIKEALDHGNKTDLSSQAAGETTAAANQPSSEPPQDLITSAAVAPPPGDQNISFFYEALYPYGNWLDVDGTWCWQPNAATISVDWAPYCRHGHWVSSDWGWCWNSDYSWGWAPFHYGRWFRHPMHGWCWAPDNEWGPAWVAWRWGDDYCGWAPLPPRTRFDRNNGFYFGDKRVGEDFEFNLGFQDYFFLSAGHFCDPHPWVNLVPTARTEEVFRRTAFLKGSYGYEHDHIVNRGPAVENISRVMNKRITPVAIVSANLKPGQPISRGLLKENQLIVYKPALATGAPKNPEAVRSVLEKRQSSSPQAKSENDAALVKRRSTATEKTMKDQQLKAENARKEESAMQKAAQNEADNNKRAGFQAESQIRTMNAVRAENRITRIKQWSSPAERRPAIIPQSRVIPQAPAPNRERVQTQMRKQVLDEARIEQQRQPAAEEMIRSRASSQHNDAGHSREEEKHGNSGK